MPPIGEHFKARPSGACCWYRGFNLWQALRVDGIVDIMTRLNEQMTAIIISGAVVAALLNPAAAQSVPSTNGWVILHSSEGRYHVMIPANWDEDHQGQASTDLSFRPRKETAAAAMQYVNCKVVVGSNPDIAASTQEALDAAVSGAPAPSGATKELLATLGKDAVLRENSLTQVSNHPAYFFVVAGSHETASITILAVAAEVVLVRPGLMYSLACTAGARTAIQAEVAWNTWEPTFKGIMSTFDSEDH